MHAELCLSKCKYTISDACDPLLLQCVSVPTMAAVSLHNQLSTIRHKH